MILNEHNCTKCGKLRRFAEGTVRDFTKVCGHCWDWKRFP